MVFKMAAEGIRGPSPSPPPPLAPDPSPRTVPSMQTSQPPPAGSQQTSPATSSADQPRQGLKRVDSSRTPQRQPIKDAVTDAFEQSPVTNQLNSLNQQLDPDFIKHVTEQVIKSLHAAGAAPTASSVQPQQTQYPPPPPPQQSQEPRSPTLSFVDSGAARFTPPSPSRNQEAREAGVASPSPTPSDTGSNISQRSRHSIRSDESDRNTPRPFQSDTSSRAPTSNYTNRRRAGTIPHEDRANRDGGGYDNTVREKTPFRRDSRDRDYDGASRSQVRQPTEQADTGETPLERFWQPLFDNGNPTMRLSQFLRGLALHLIDDCEPKGSLVVTPAKMLQFMKDTRVEHEHYPWETIFGGRMSTVSISFMFQKLLCQHHLVQDRYDRVPTVPGLTPYGFDWFMTCLIQAHPDTEYERLAKAVMHMPISNADNKTERFPKELSRRLLPSRANFQAEQRLVSSLDHEPHVIATLRNRSHIPPPPSHPPPARNEPERRSFDQRSQQSNAFDDDDLAGPRPVQIERERQPYFAKEGSGKQYDDARANVGQSKQESSNNPRTTRTNSGLPPQTTYASSSGPTDPVNIPSRQPHRPSTNQVPPPPMANGNYSRSAKRSPPPMRNPFARSEPEFVGSMPSSQYGSNLHPSQSREPYTPVDPDDDQLKRYRSRSRADRSGANGSNPNDDDMNGGRGYPIPGRSVPVGSGGYEYGSGVPGGPPMGGDPRAQQGGNMHAVGSFPRQPTMGAEGNDNRRKSMYGSSNIGLGGDGGTDGYGSFAGSMNGGPGYPPPPPQQQPYGTSSQH